jgi:hypothetical protein
MEHVQGIVTFWCNVLGVVDPASLQIASGIVGAVTLLFIPMMLSRC